VSQDTATGTEELLGTKLEELLAIEDESTAELELGSIDELLFCVELLELKGQVLLKEPPLSQWSKDPSRHIPF